VVDVVVIDLHRWFDQDGDTLDDRWESTFGLSVSSGTGPDGPTGDPDGDGLTNAQELAAGTHPRGTELRYLAEGATGSFFSTRIALANPHLSDASAVLSITRPGAAAVTLPVFLPAQRRVTVDPATIPGLQSADFSITIESDRPLGVDRTVFWPGAPEAAAVYGAHTEAAVAAPATTWYLAEGSTVVDFNLFYLLQNPQSMPVQATVRFLRPSGAPIVKTYDLPPDSRTTIYVNLADALLDETDVSAEITATAPIVVERAMYANRPGQPFALGHGAAGVTTPSTRWFLAEGATGTFFDLYVLVANPGTTDAASSARCTGPAGSSTTTRVTARRARRRRGCGGYSQRARQAGPGWRRPTSSSRIRRRQPAWCA
jgi:hypothetical protein